MTWTHMGLYLSSDRSTITKGLFTSTLIQVYLYESVLALKALQSADIGKLQAGTPTQSTSAFSKKKCDDR